MASNQVEAFRRARDSYEQARKNGVKGQVLATLKADMDAKKAATPGGRGMD